MFCPSTTHRHHQIATRLTEDAEVGIARGTGGYTFRRCDENPYTKLVDVVQGVRVRGFVLERNVHSKKMKTEVTTSV